MSIAAFKIRFYTISNTLYRKCLGISSKFQQDLYKKAMWPLTPLVNYNHKYIHVLLTKVYATFPSMISEMHENGLIKIGRKTFERKGFGFKPEIRKWRHSWKRLKILMPDLLHTSLFYSRCMHSLMINRLHDHLSSSQLFAHLFKWVWAQWVNKMRRTRLKELRHRHTLCFTHPAPTISIVKFINGKS